MYQFSKETNVLRSKKIGFNKPIKIVSVISTSKKYISSFQLNRRTSGQLIHQASEVLDYQNPVAPFGS